MTDQVRFFAEWAKELDRPTWADDDPEAPPLHDAIGGTSGPAQHLVSAIEEQADAEDAEEDDADPRPIWDGMLRPTDTAVDLQAAIGIVQFHLGRTEERLRARKSRDAQTRADQITATICSLAKALQRGDLSVRIPMRDELLKKASRYKCPLQTATLRTVIRQLIEEGFMIRTEEAERPRVYGHGLQFRGSQAGYKSGQRLATLLQGVSLSDICRLTGDEIILLKTKRDEVGLTALVEYQREPAHIKAARAELVELNAFRAAADINCLGSPVRFDVSDRHSRRRWTRANWYCGGRHWGGFWQSMRKADRLNLIRIDGEPVVGIDYTGTIVTLAYAAVGQELPDGDPYNFTLVDRDGREVSSTRKQRKTIFIAAMNGAKEWPREMREQFRHRISWRRTVDCLKKAHPLIAVYFDADKGQELAYTEANIMAAVLKTLRLRSVVALDMFDCVLVKQSALDAARAAMLEEFQRITGKPARVSVERPEDYPLHTAASLLDQAAGF